MKDPNDMHEDLAGLSSRVASVESDIKNLASGVVSLQRSVDKMSEQISAGKKTDWAVVGTWAGLVVTVLTVVGALSVFPLKDGLYELKRNQRHHESLHSHPAAQVQFEELMKSYEGAREALKQQDTYLQREMRDLDSGIKNELVARIESLDTVLQREMRLLIDSLDQQQAITNRQVNRLIELIKIAGAVNAAQQERLNGLERTLKPKQ